MTFYKILRNLAYIDFFVSMTKRLFQTCFDSFRNHLKCQIYEIIKHNASKISLLTKFTQPIQQGDLKRTRSPTRIYFGGTQS